MAENNENKELQNRERKYCETISKSIFEIIRFSLNEDFRKKSFALFNATCTKETENKICEGLKNIIMNGSRTIVNNHASAETDDAAESRDENPSADDSTMPTLEETEATSSSNTWSADSQSSILSSQIFERNWLEISSQKYKESMTILKSKYYHHSYHQDINDSNTSLTDFNYGSEINDENSETFLNDSFFNDFETEKSNLIFQTIESSSQEDSFATKFKNCLQKNYLESNVKRKRIN